LKSASFIPASITPIPAEDRYLITCDRHRTAPLDKLAAYAFLVSAMDLRDDASRELLKQAATTATHFWIKPASALQVGREWPQIDPGYDAALNARIGEQWSVNLPTMYRGSVTPGHRAGDAARPDQGSGPNEDFMQELVMSAPPSQIAQASKQLNLPQVFDHGVVGSLVKSFNVVDMIRNYVPKLEQAIDVMARILFLFHWKPDDFNDAYGVEEASNFENSITSCFEALGDVALDLKLKIRERTNGSPGL
jgi:hypothetical protein